MIPNKKFSTLTAYKKNIPTYRINKRKMPSDKKNKRFSLEKKKVHKRTIYSKKNKKREQTKYHPFGENPVILTRLILKVSVVLLEVCRWVGFIFYPRAKKRVLEGMPLETVDKKGENRTI